MKKRLWLLTPAALLYSVDIGLTLTGQPASYWAGDYATAEEANPLAYPLLAYSPWLFGTLAVVWLLLFAGMILGGRRSWVRWVAFLLAFAHTLGAASWLTRVGSWGLLVAGVYVVGAAQLARWCWQRARVE